METSCWESRTSTIALYLRTVGSTGCCGRDRVALPYGFPRDLQDRTHRRACHSRTVSARSLRSGCLPLSCEGTPRCSAHWFSATVSVMSYLNRIGVAPLLQIVVAGHKVFKLLDELKRDGMTAFPPCISYLGTKEQETTTTHP